MHRLDQLLILAMEKRASDLHLSADEPPRARVDGDLVDLSTTVLSAKEVQDLVLEILTPAERDKFLHAKNLDKSYVQPEIGSFRVNLFFTRRGVAAVLRTIPTKIPRMEDLNLPPVLKTLAELPKGLILVTGPTGSGKSTTLSAMINHLNENFPLHILTVEDPVEFVHPSKQSLVNQREIGHSCPTFADALKYALREDPDVILIGEMRDLETIALALTAAETGHLVFGTLHTRGAAASIDRIIDSFPSSQQSMIRTMLSESLAGVVSQSLIKRADKKGRVAAYEIMVVNHAIANLIREGKSFQIEGAIQTGRKEGMVLMEQSVRELLAQKLITPEDAQPYFVGLLAADAGKAAPAAAPKPASGPAASPLKAGGSPAKATAPASAPIVPPVKAAPAFASAPQAAPLKPVNPFPPVAVSVVPESPSDHTSVDALDLSSGILVEEYVERETRAEVLDFEEEVKAAPQGMPSVPKAPVPPAATKAVPPLPFPKTPTVPTTPSPVPAKGKAPMPPPLPNKKAS